MSRPSTFLVYLFILLGATPVFAQIGEYDIDESEPVQQTNITVASDTTIRTGESAGTVNVTISRKMNNSTPDEAQMVNRRGTIQYFVALGLEYAVALPLSISGMYSMEPGPMIGGLVVGAVASGLQIGGAIRSGVGASMAYDYNRKQGLGMSKNKNWGFYRAGWVLAAIGGVLGNVNTLSGQPSVELSYASLGVSIAAQALWITSVANASQYTREAVNKTDYHSGIVVTPKLCYNGKSGFIGLQCSF